MALIEIEILNVSASPTDVCRNMLVDVRIINNINEGAELFNFDLVYNLGASNEQTIQITTADVVSNTGGVKTFEKTIDIQRPFNTGVVNFKVLNPFTGDLYLYNQNQPINLFPNSWDIQSVTVQTDINGVGTVSMQTTPTGSAYLPLQIEVSVDDVNYFATNVITGLIAGTYTLYVRDVFGCQKTSGFVVSSENSFETFNNFKFASLLNPVPFTEINLNRPSFANRPSYSIDDHYLSKNNKYKFLQVDTLRFQFRSNYDVNKAYLFSCGEIVEELTVNKRSENLNQRDIRDARFYFENGFLYAYYDGTGSIYDNDGNIIGSNDLNGSLLFDQVAGESLSIETLGVIQILEVVNVNGIGQVMKLNFTQPVANTYLEITTYFNLENFEVYEFDLSMAQAIGDYQVIIVNNATADFDVNNPLENATFISEVISIVDSFRNEKFKFVWKNSENNQFSWDMGIECFNYMPKTYSPEFQPKDENKIYNTDTTAFMLESDVYDTFIFTIERVSQIMARQLMMMTSNDYLKIDDNFYVKEETPEVTRLGVSDAYNVKLTLTLASNYNSNSREGLTNNSNLADNNGFLRLY